jgi:hypothetical protein
MPLVAPVMTAILPSSRPMSFSFYESLFPYHPGLRPAKQAMPAAASHLPLPVAFFLYGRPYFRCSGRLNGTDGEMD